MPTLLKIIILIYVLGLLIWEAEVFSYDKFEKEEARAKRNKYNRFNT